MDGVLFNSMPYHADAWHKVMKRHGLHLSREEAYMHEGRTGASTINIVYQRQYGKDATPEMIESIYAEKSAEFSTHPEPERMPGAWEVLQKVKAAGLTPVLVTGSGQHSLLNRLAHNFPGMFQRDHMETTLRILRLCCRPLKRWSTRNALPARRNLKLTLQSRTQKRHVPQQTTRGWILLSL